MHIVYKILIIFAICNTIYGNSINIEFIESKPKGIARDFYIYEYLQNNANEDEALKLYDLIENKSQKILKMLKLKISPQNLPREIYCKDLPFDELLKEDDSCLNLGFRLNYAIKNKITPEILKRLTNKNTLRQIKILSTKNKLDSILKASGEDFNDIYFSIDNKEDIFNKSSKYITQLSNKNFSKAIYHMVISKKYPKFTKTLLNKNIVGVNDWSFFALALNELENGNKQKALTYFANAQKTTNIKSLRDRAIFWQYKISGKEHFLKELANSNNFNLYSLFAVQKLQVSPKYDIISQSDSIFAKLDDKESPFDIENPFEWQILSSNIALIKDKESLLDVAKLFYYKDTLPHLIFVLNRYYNFSKNFFIMPYCEDLDIDDEMKNLVFAIARQESKFIPSVVSPSYALGLMQIMPFNVAGFAKEQNLDDISLDDMFNPKTALQFGAYYVNHLKKEFKHPMFISYAYNGGPTFIRNYLANEKVFSKNNKYDPWLSMEFIPYEESRFYAMRVMANYIVYSEINNKQINVESFLNEALR